MLKKLIASALAIGVVLAPVSVPKAADSVIYTFSGTNYITDGSTDDITDKPLTKDISVTTSGDMNRKYAAVTTVAENSKAGTFPINETFKADGSYIYLGCANVNDNTVITLNLPEIKAGSRVTLTYAKPEVTNNGSTRRNSNDPYAYLKIADRYVSINGGDFDTWCTASVVTGEDTNAIEFCCDKWGAIAISKIEIADGGNVKLHSLDIHSAQYANLTVNGIKFYADADGEYKLTSLPEGETVNVTAAKDGYVTADKTVTIGGADAVLDMPLECETDAVYYESDFGNKDGTLVLDGEFALGGGIEAKDVTKISGYVTFKEGGRLALNTDKGKAVEITYKDGIYIGDEFITPKDNMEFKLVFDKGNNAVLFSQNNEPRELESIDTDFGKINSISGSGAAVEYIGISYPDKNKLAINGPDKVASYPMLGAFADYDIDVDYFYGTCDAFKSSVAGVDNEKSFFSTWKFPVGFFMAQEGVTGNATLCLEYNGIKASKEIEIVSDPKISEWKHDGANMNIGSSRLFKITDIKDEYGNDIDFMLSLFEIYTDNFFVKDCHSSDESVITIDRNGMMYAVGEGTATITANIYTGADNYVSVDYTVAPFAIDGITEGEVSYTAGELINDSITGYKITYSDGTSEDIAETDIPAAVVLHNGKVITAYYDADGKLDKTKSQIVNEGDKMPVSNGSKHVYTATAAGIEEHTGAHTTTRGYEIKHAAGEKYEIAPVYRFENIGDVKEPKTLDGIFEDGYYDITFKKAETGRGDIYVNGAMVGNNVDQADADRKVEEGALYKAEDVKITGGKISVSMADGSTKLDYVIVEKKPEFYERPQRVYIIGDSLACIYYGEFEHEVGGGRSGWGQQIGDFLNVPVTDLANSGQFAAGLYRDAFPGVMANAEAGDILLIECGYNDRAYSSRDEMRDTVKKMIDECRAAGITPILVTPNASQHDYKPSVVWSSYLRDVAIDKNCELIDLSEKSYNFLYSLYGDNADGVITKNYNLTEVGGDTLHSSYAGAYKWASIVAQGLKDLGYGDIVNTEFKYTFTDTLGNEITAEVK